MSFRSPGADGGFVPYHPPQAYPVHPVYARAPGFPGWAPGVIPLRPLSLSDIFNGAVAFIRKNPKATLGLTTIVVVLAQLVTLSAQIGPLAALGGLGADVQGEPPSTGALAWFSGATLFGVLITQLASVLLTGMLTVIVGRSILGGTVTIGQAWERLRSRFLALVGLTLLEGVVLVVGAVVVVGLIAAAGAVGGGVAAFVVGAPLVLVAALAAVFGFTVVLFTPALIVLERLSVFAAIARSFALVKPAFWRVLGIWLLASLVAAVIAGAVGAPFSIVGQLMSMSPDGVGMSITGLVLVAVGGTVGQIVTAPFAAGVDVLLYTDRRIRSEAFDLVLQTGAYTPAGPAESTDQLWLVRHF
ncbi:hypothetical protein [Mycolicibacterium goodii]